MSEVELVVGPYPFTKKMVLSVRIGAVSYILARFDSEARMKAFLALNPKHDANVDVETLKEILK